MNLASIDRGSLLHRHRGAMDDIAATNAIDVLAACFLARSTSHHPIHFIEVAKEQNDFGIVVQQEGDNALTAKQKYQKAWYKRNKKCISARQKRYYKRNKKRISARTKIYRKKNKSYFKAYNKAYQKKNAKRIKTYRKHNAKRRNAQARSWRKRNAAHVSAYGKTYRKHHAKRYKAYSIARIKSGRAARYAKEYRERYPARYKASKKSFRKRHAMRIAANQLKYRKERRRHDLIYRLAWYTSAKINKILKANSLTKSFATFDVLPYTPQQLVAHLERHFLPGMTLTNHGYGKDKWHVDHKRPLASFDIRDFDAPKALVRKAFALSNLRPMWQDDNQQKSCNWNGYRWSRGRAVSFTLV